MSTELPAWCCASGCSGCDAFREWMSKQTTKPTRKEKSKVYHRALYRHRKEHSLCVDCGAGLQPDDASHCVECDAKAKEAKQRYNSTPRFRARHARRYRERTRAGKCAHCDEKVCAESTSLCAVHLARHRVYQKRYEVYRRNDVTPITSAKPSPSKARKEIAAYRPLDELQEQPRVRILLALSWLEWPTASELFDVLGVKSWMADDHTEHDRYSGMLRNLAKARVVEKRGSSKYPDYRLTDKGRAEVSKIRAGNYATEIKRPRRAA